MSRGTLLGALFVCIALLFTAALGLSVWWGAVEVDSPKVNLEPKLSLEDAYRQWHKGLTSGNQQDRAQTLRSMLPEKKDIDYLFPQHADKLWPSLEQGHRYLINNVDKVTQELQAKGAIQKITLIHVREDKIRATGNYKRLLELAPKDMPLFDLRVEGEHRSGRSVSGTYLHLHNRWLWIKDLDAFPDILDRLQ